MNKYVVWSIVLIATFALIAYFSFRPSARPFRFGLDLVGGTELIYRADTQNVSDPAGAMDSLKEVIERRVNIFGVSEPLVQTEGKDRLLVELPGIADLDEAKRVIGRTPILEFKLASSGENNEEVVLTPTGLTGQLLSRARVEFDPSTRLPYVFLEFNNEGRELFAKITGENIGKVLAIVLDGEVISAPVIQDAITDGHAQITGSFNAEQARTLVRDLNYGALPVPITLSTSQTIGATLGEVALNAGIRAGVIGFIALSLFLIVWYRLPGFVASIALVAYVILSLTVFKLIPVTLTAAGLAGFILSIGMAVDANVLIFERAKEEMKKGRSIHDALHEGFKRAWLSIRDSNIASIITAIVLFWLGTSAVKGFALTLGIGVLISMFTAITVSRTFLFAIAPKKESNFKRFMFSNGLHVRN